MKKKLLTFILSIAAVVSCAFGFSACEEEHTHSYTRKITTEATCTEKGVMTYTCSCNDTYTEEIPATGVHTWGQGKFVTEPTCTEKGVKTFTCTVCNTATYTEDVPALMHDKVQHEAQAAMCTKKGWGAYETCSRCDYTTYTEIPATGLHAWDNGEVTTEPACAETGVKTFTCTVCNTATYTEDIPALTHDKVQHNAQAATCAEKGWEAYETCTRCDYSTYAEIPARGHDYIYHQGQAVTCLEIGWDEYNTCSHCDYNEYVEIPLQHNATGNNGYCLGCGLPESAPGLKYSQNADGTYTITGIGIPDYV